MIRVNEERKENTNRSSGNRLACIKDSSWADDVNEFVWRLAGSSNVRLMELSQAQIGHFKDAAAAGRDSAYIFPQAAGNYFQRTRNDRLTLFVGDSSV